MESAETEPRKDRSTDDIELWGGTASESGLTQVHTPASLRDGAGRPIADREANVILIAHPEGRRLGSRFRLSPGTILEIGRSNSVVVSLPEVASLSRRHARLRYADSGVILEDLGSTNGTYLNGSSVSGTARLESGDRFQVAAVHFKFLHEKDVEHAYYEAIYDLVTRDGLTDVFNRRKYDEEVEREVARARRHGRPLSLLLIDVDDFKSVNDRYGHLCGDFVLKQVIAEMKPFLRPDDILARIGGDEFAVLAPETDSEGARALAERIRALLSEFVFDYGEHKIPVSCSFGVAELGREESSSPRRFFDAADRALYRAKREGRNRVAVSSSDD